MTQPFLQTIDDLRHTVKVNASFKFEILEPYLQDAFDRYIVPYLGEALVDRLYREPQTEDVLTIKTLTSRTLGPLAVALASPELGVLLYSDPTDNGNFYAEQLTSLEAVIEDYIKVYAPELGLPAPIKNDFNSKDKHIFVL